MSKIITRDNIKDLQVGDRGSYPGDLFFFSWVGRSNEGDDLEFMPDDLIHEWNKRLTGKDRLNNKEYTIIHIDLWNNKILALYSHDFSLGIIKLEIK